MTGRDMSSLLQFLVDAANTGAIFPQLPQVWTQFAQLQTELAKSDIEELFKHDASILTFPNDRAPVTPQRFERIIQEVKERCSNAMKMSVDGLHEMSDKPETDEMQSLVRIANDLRNELCRRTSMYCMHHLEKDKRIFKKKISDLKVECPRVPSSLMIKLNHLREEHMEAVLTNIRQEDNTYDQIPCCKTEINKYQESIKAMIDELMKHNKVEMIDAIRISAAKAKDQMEKEMPTADLSAIKIDEKSILAKLDEIAEKSLRDFDANVIAIGTTHECIASRVALVNELQLLKDLGHQYWNETCRTTLKNILQSAIARMFISIKRTLPFPAAEELLRDAISEQREQIKGDFESMFCHGSDTWNEYRVHADMELDIVSTTLDNENVDAIKRLSQDPLEKAAEVLKELASDYYIHYQFVAVARRKALEALREAAKEQKIELTPRLEEKVVDSFVNNDLGNALWMVHYNLFSRVMSVLIGAVASYNAYASIRKLRITKTLGWTGAMVFVTWTNVAYDGLMNVVFLLINLGLLVTRNIIGNLIGWFITSLAILTLICLSLWFLGKKNVVVRSGTSMLGFVFGGGGKCTSPPCAHVQLPVQKTRSSRLYH
eukprot:GHVO01011784.1.p1 GENE.GHVO01011784.1~~GHVO01011784.1.p1  ORF type:complete len:603 (+),score=106.97 GHVO01011784.1:689-2497(+)